jgi:hypothetical protein
MRPRSRRIILGAMGIICACLMGVALASGQSAAQGAQAEQKPLPADQVFKNIQLLKGVPVDEFLQTMGFFSASTGMNCLTCHTEASGNSWANYADDTPLKQRARMMILMVTALNRTYFDGRSVVTCWSCHRGTRAPRVIPDLAIQYSDAPDAEPDEIMPVTAGVPSVDQIIDKYIQALGGAQRLSSVTSFTGQGMYQGFETAFAKIPVDVFAKAPDQRATVVHMLDGDSTTTYDGHVGWVAAPDTMKPIPFIQLTGGDLDGAKLDAAVSFPARIKTLLSDWLVGFPEMINDHEVQVIQGRLTPNGLPVKLYFDSASGLLVRMVHYSNSPVGVNPTQVDYSDYRDVSGIRMPFRWVVTWTDDRSTYEMSEMRANVPIDASKFGKPPASVTKAPVR